LTSAARFSNCGAFFRVCRPFQSVAHFSEYAAFSQVSSIFPSVPHYFKWAGLFQMGRILLFLGHFPSVAFFYFFPVWRVFPCLSIFDKRGTFF